MMSELHTKGRTVVCQSYVGSGEEIGLWGGRGTSDRTGRMSGEGEEE